MSNPCSIFFVPDKHSIYIQALTSPGGKPLWSQVTKKNRGEISPGASSNEGLTI